MAKRVTPEEIVEMHRLYKIHGTYAEVGRRIGRSGSTVANYIKMKNVPTALRITVEKLMRYTKGDIRDEWKIYE